MGWEKWSRPLMWETISRSLMSTCWLELGKADTRSWYVGLFLYFLLVPRVKLIWSDTWEKDTRGDHRADRAWKTWTHNPTWLHVMEPILGHFSFRYMKSMEDTSLLLEVNCFFKNVFYLKIYLYNIFLKKLFLISIH